jgi:hypothetical protein
LQSFDDTILGGEDMMDRMGTFRTTMMIENA